METKLVLYDPTKHKLDPEGNFQLGAKNIPNFRFHIAVQNKVEKKILLKSCGGIGDMITAEPTIRYAIHYFKNYDISLQALEPSLYQHLNFSNVFDFDKNPCPDESQYYVFNLIYGDEDLPWQFICGLYTHCVDFSSLCAFRMTLPIRNKTIMLLPSEKDFQKVDSILDAKLIDNYVVVHAGKHWQSKTFPKWWWDDVLYHLKKNNIIPILIGGRLQSKFGDKSTVDVFSDNCIDFRNKLTIMETVSLLNRTKVLLTNDSAPLHMAASTSSMWIGFIATCKHYEYIMHYRMRDTINDLPIFGFRMENLSLGGIWEKCHSLSNANASEVPEEWLLQWLPAPISVSNWAIDKLKKIY